jgi:AraC-like DNA-binding protein
MQATLPPHPDPLGEALHSLRMSGTMYCRCEFSAPWALALPAMHGFLMFHVMTSGKCWLEINGDQLCLLSPAELALVPHGNGHKLSSEPGLPAPGLFDLSRDQVSKRYEILRHGGCGAVTTMLCGGVHFDHPAAQHLVKLLPRVITIDASTSPESEWIQATLRYMSAEARELRPGGETVITRLADILVIQAIRWWLGQNLADQKGWLGALQDAQIGRAISLIHREPARGWTVASLASELAMSRSAFAARFTTLVGETPMHFVARSRMYLAVTWLKQEQARLAEVAARLGYQSEAAFSRAFKRFIGVSPGAVRRNKQSGDDQRDSG